MLFHNTALYTLHDPSYIQTIEADNQLLQEELERVLMLVAKQAIQKQPSNVMKHADAVLKNN